MSDPARAIFLPYQQRWAADGSQVKIWEKSRRIGASYGEAANAVLHAAAATGGGDVYYISYNRDMTQSFVRDCGAWAGAAAAVGEQVLTRDDGRDIHVFDIPFASGHRIQAFSGNPRNLRSKGRPGDWVVIDEAAFVDDLGDMLKASMAITMWGGHVHLMSTHNGADNPFNGLIEDVRAGRYPYSLHRTTLDDALTDGLYRRICQVTGRPWSAQAQAQWRDDLIRRYRPNAEEELFVIPAQGGGAYLPRVLIEACMPPAEDSGPLIRYQGRAAFNAQAEPDRARAMEDWLRDQVYPVLATLNPARRHVAGWDFARSGDMTCLVLVELADERDAYAGHLVVPVKISEATYRTGFPRYKAGLEDRTTVLVRHEDILEDHRAVQLVRGVPRVPEGKTDVQGQRHGDSAIAGLLADLAASAADDAPQPPAVGGTRRF